jgi:hypothetical protein
MTLQDFLCWAVTDMPHWLAACLSSKSGTPEERIVAALAIRAGIVALFKRHGLDLQR